MTMVMGNEGNGHTKHLPEEWRMHFREPIPELPFYTMGERFNQEVLVKRGHLAGTATAVGLLVLVNVVPALSGQDVSIEVAIATSVAFVGGASFMTLMRYAFGRSR